ncbi:serine hydrolase [Pollutibacter soli]|uniref:serine hydrolase n=1 Tax=Pollutibacter soli TaxID=3034157 RepID=UPI003013CB54
MRKLLFLFILIPQLVSGQWKAKIKTVDSVLAYLHSRKLFNGAVLIGENGKVIYKKALGIADTSGRPLSTYSAFNLASVSKQFFAMMIMMLKEQGKLEYDQTVQKYLESFPYTGITIRHLLNHTSGLPEYFTLAERHMTLVDTLDNEKMFAMLVKYKPAVVFQPGDKYEYCNTNYILLASVISKLAGMSCAEFFDQRIVRPLGLKNTYVYNLTMHSYPASRVFGFHYEKEKPVPDDLQQLDGIVGDGNIYSSVEDLYLWDQALYTSKLVKAETFKEAISSGKLNNDSLINYGFGWSVRKAGESTHSGGWVAFTTYIHRYYEKRQTYITLENSGNNWVHSIVRNILEGNPYHLPQTTLINNVVVIDGTGSTPRKENLRIVDDRIQDIGPLTPFAGETVINGEGQVLSPGFIDSHSHLYGSLDEKPEALAAISQGITTIVAGQDGSSDAIDSLKFQIAKRPPNVNVATYTGQGSLRDKIMKGDLSRAATQPEIDAMKKELASEMQKGSLGLSTGLEYEDAFYSTRDEVIALAKTAAEYNGRYISHIRSEDIHIENSIEEIIQIGRETKIPVQISHFKIAMRSRWGIAPDLLARLEAARTEGINITADVYPYRMWSSTPRVLFPKKDFTNTASAIFAVNNLIDPAESIITGFPSDKRFEGKSLIQIGNINQESADKALLRIISESERSKQHATIIGVSMYEPDIVNLLKWSHTNLCSDGGEGGHPRGYGAFTRMLGFYVRDQKIMPLETAINKMTALSAEHLGIKNRGILAQGYPADLVLFNPDQVRDNATIADPKALSSGISIVWVNGRIVYQDQKATPAFSGKFIGRQ